MIRADAVIVPRPAPPGPGTHPVRVARLPLGHPDGVMVNCPMDDGSAEVLALAYPGRPDTDLWITLSGCRGVSNGYISGPGI